MPKLGQALESFYMSFSQNTGSPKAPLKGHAIHGLFPVTCPVVHSLLWCIYKSI